MTETQNGFRKGRPCTDPIFYLKLLIEKRREFNLETHLLFIDYEKGFYNLKDKFYLKFWNPDYCRHIVKGNSGFLHTKQNIYKI